MTATTKIIHILVSATLFLAVLVSPLRSVADTATTVGALRYKQARMSAIFDGTHAYLFGGFTKAIYKFDPVSSSVTTRNSLLPVSYFWLADETSAVWTGEYAYIFGGTNDGRVLRYDTSSDTLTTLSAVVGSGRAIWTGEYAYVFGRTKITRYDPQTDTAAQMNATLPDRSYTSAAYDGNFAYIIGGERNEVTSDEILRYDPAADTVQLYARLPSPRSEAAAAWDGKDIYILGGILTRPVSTGYGGWYDGYATGEILRFDPRTKEMGYMSTYLDPGRGGMAAVWDGKRIFTFGGYYEEQDQPCQYCWTLYKVMVDHIMKYELTPGPPRNFQVLPGLAPGRIDISWSAPNYDTYSPSSPIQSFKIYRRSFVAGGSYQLIGTTSGYYTNFYDYGCPVGEVCYYRVAAINDRGEGTMSGAAPMAGWTYGNY